MVPVIVAVLAVVSVVIFISAFIVRVGQEAVPTTARLEPDTDDLALRVDAGHESPRCARKVQRRVFPV
jgi:hypothetical protein